MLPGRSLEKLLVLEVGDDLVRRVAVLVLDPPALAARRRLAERVDLRLRSALAGLVRVDSEVAGTQGLLGLLLRAHDPLQRRIAWVVDRIRHRDDAGQGRLDD